MKILVVGSGGREHAICYKLNQSPQVEKIYCIPGNAGIDNIATCIDMTVDNIEGIVNFALEQQIDLVVIGPEAPLVLGLADRLIEKSISVFGPNQKAAQFEGSKAYSKQFMERYHIPTAAYGIYTQPEQALVGLTQFNTPVVIKADGLAAGKGVLICNSMQEAREAIESIMEKRQFGVAGEKVVIEEFLTGTEASLLCFVDGHRIIPMESARDYKKAYDGDEGLNTGGMGGFSPNPIYTESLKKNIETSIMANILTGLKSEDINFRGVLFIGLMIEGDDAKVLEFNVRFGDPETQVVLPRLESDLVEIMLKVIDGNLYAEDLKWSDKESATVVIASGGYPDVYEKGKLITGLDEIDEGILVFHAGTKKTEQGIVTNGGRVMAITCIDTSIERARDRIYRNIDKVNFEGKQYRTDIARF